jgi:hypothetical protein
MAVASTINYSIQRLQNVNHAVIYLFPLLDDTAMNVCRRAGMRYLLFSSLNIICNIWCRLFDLLPWYSIYLRLYVYGECLWLLHCWRLPLRLCGSIFTIAASTRLISPPICIDITMMKRPPGPFRRRESSSSICSLFHYSHPAFHRRPFLIYKEGQWSE